MAKEKREVHESVMSQMIHYEVNKAVLPHVEMWLGQTSSIAQHVAAIDQKLSRLLEIFERREPRREGREEIAELESRARPPQSETRSKIRRWNRSE